MDTLTLWFLVVVIALITFSTRGAFTVLFSRTTLPDTLQNALRVVPAAVFTALVVPQLVIPAGAVDVSPLSPVLTAAFGAAIIAWRWKNTLVTIVTGMALLHLAQVLLR